MDLTVATELGGLAGFGDRRRGYGWLTGFDGYNRVFSWYYCCFHFYCHSRESSWWSEGQSERFGSVLIVFLSFGVACHSIRKLAAAQPAETSDTSGFFSRKGRFPVRGCDEKCWPVGRAQSESCRMRHRRSIGDRPAARYHPC